jgi:hypothetical protein
VNDASAGYDFNMPEVCIQHGVNLYVSSHAIKPALRYSLLVYRPGIVCASSLHWLGFWNRGMSEEQAVQGWLSAECPR